MRGNAIGHRQKLKQAKVFTVLSYLVGAGYTCCVCSVLYCVVFQHTIQKKITTLLNPKTLKICLEIFILKSYILQFKVLTLNYAYSKPIQDFSTEKIFHSVF